EGHLSDIAIDAYRRDGSLAWSYYHAYGIAFQAGFTPDGQTLMVAGGWDTPPKYVEGGADTILRLNPTDGREVLHFAGQRGLSNSVSLSPANQLCSSRRSSTKPMWNVA